VQAIAGKEGYLLDLDAADGVAASAAGDLRNAIHNLQVMLQSPGGKLPAAGAAAATGRKGKVSARSLPGH
jgi:DNA polymerase III delta prime subunit